jgi:predicted phosphodiesterase
MELTTVSTHHAVFHMGEDVVRIEGLEPANSYEHHGVAYKTLPELGQLLSVFTTVNDVHFGETVCGVIQGSDMGPVFSVEEGETPYPEVMNRAAAEEMQALDPDLVLVKGDLTNAGTLDEYQQFLDCYGNAFGDRLHHIRGNHDAYDAEHIQTVNQKRIELPGVIIATIDTVRPGSAGGTVYDHDLEWLEALAREATQPVLIFGHHHVWDPATSYRSEDYFGIQPDESEKFIKLVARHDALRGFFAGHTHRNRVRYFPQTGNFPWVEVGCVKDFPGNWAEYRVYDNGILQINHRISSRDALAWTERTRDMYNGTYFDYAFGKLSDRCFVVLEL